MKKCTVCKELKPEAAFGRRKQTKNGLQARCRVCRNVDKQTWRAAHPGAEVEQHRDYRAKNAEFLRAQARGRYYADVDATRARKRAQYLHSEYGLSMEAVGALHTAQLGACAICSAPGEPSGMGQLNVDHDHADGRVRGLLCANCNSMLGHARDIPETLRAGARYLIGPPRRALELLFLQGY